MAKTTKNKETTVVVTRAEKKDATKSIIKDLLAVKPYKHNELIDETAKIYTERFAGEDTENVNDVKGRVGSVLDIMKKESEVMYEGGMYALKARLPMPAPEEKKSLETEEKPAKKPTRTRTKKAEKAEEVKAEEAKETPAPKKRGRKPKTEEPKTEEVKTEEVQPAEAKAEEPTPKKRGRKPKAKAPVEEEPKEDPKPTEKPAETVEPESLPAPLPTSVPAPVEIEEEPKTEEKQEEPAKTEPIKTEVKNPPVVKEKAEVAKKNVVMDMSFLFGEPKPKKPEVREFTRKEEPKPVKAEEVKAEVKEEKPAPAPMPKAEKKPENKPVRKAEAPKAEERKTEEKREAPRGRNVRKTVERPQTAEDKLRESFLKRMRSLGGDYFEYYSVYLLERYSMKNGRRLEGMRICGGDRDGGIDGEIELTDKFGFKETIYIQAKNWDPDKGDEKLWVVGETLLQQFIGACACKQAKDGKQHCRGIFITTSRFTSEAKQILETMSDKIVGYDGADLFEAAKECEFGIVKKNGEWALDERLLSGSKAFFNML